MTISGGLLSLTVALFLAWKISDLKEPPAFAYVALTIFAAVPIVLILRQDINNFRLQTPQGEWSAHLRQHESEPSKPSNPPEQHYKEAIRKALPRAKSEQQGEVVERVVQTDIQLTAERVRSRMLDSVLREIAARGKEASRQLAEQYGNVEAFRRDMGYLRTEGVIQCDRDNLNSCEATERGKKVAEVIGRPFTRCTYSSDCPGAEVCIRGQCILP